MTHPSEDLANVCREQVRSMRAYDTNVHVGDSFEKTPIRTVHSLSVIIHYVRIVLIAGTGVDGISR